MGGNVGNVSATFAKALHLLNEKPLDGRTETNLLQVSSYHATIPIGENAGAETVFLNAVCQIETSLEPLPLLDKLQLIEKKLGRERTIHWGPRTIDLDIILYDESKIDIPRLQVPHPACWYRRFVLDPLVEIASDIIHPIKQVTFQKLQERLLQQPFVVAFAGGNKITRKQLVTSLQKKNPNQFFKEWDFENSLHQKEEPTLLMWLGKEESVDFKSLPLLPRIDLSQESELLQTIQNIVDAATPS